MHSNSSPESDGDRVVGDSEMEWDCMTIMAHMQCPNSSTESTGKRRRAKGGEKSLVYESLLLNFSLLQRSILKIDSH